MRRFSVILAVTTVAMTSIAVPHRSVQAARFGQASLATKSIGSKINTLLTRLTKQHLFMGSVVIARKGTVLANKAYGLANEERHSRNTRSTKFVLASVSKQFTAMAILQLQEQGKLSVQDHVCAYLANCPAAWSAVTIHQLLNHTSGIKDSFNDDLGFDDSKYWSPEQIIALVKDEPLLFTPGTDWHYSNTGYIVLGRIIETVSGEQYGTYLHEHIFQPLGMTSTGLAQEGVPVPKLARGYSGYSLVPASLFHPATFFSAGGLYSTAGDLYLWDRALLTETLVSKKSLDAIFTPSFKFPDGSGYGYGWGIATASGRRLIIHYGGLPGVATMNAFFPDDGVTIIILTNNDMTALSVIFPLITKIIFGTKTVSLRDVGKAA